MNLSETSPKSLYDRLGGHAAVQAAVDLFYNKILQNPRVSRFFENTDMGRQRAKQVAFMTYVFGGAPNYSGTSMRRAHEKMVRENGLDDRHFDAIADILAETLREMGVARGMIDEILTIVGSTRNDVLNR